MRYILDDLGYVEAVTFGGYLECNDKSCTEYVGEVPTNYESLCDWYLNANINAYKIIDGNLVLDEDKNNEIEAELEEEITGDFSKKVTFKETYSSIHFYRRNGIVTITYQGEAKTHDVGTVLFTIPKGYRPKMPEGQNQFFFPFIKNSNAYGTCWIRISNGECIMSQISNATANGRIYFSISYVCE